MILVSINDRKCFLSKLMLGNHPFIELKMNAGYYKREALPDKDLKQLCVDNHGYHGANFG